MNKKLSIILFFFVILFSTNIIANEEVEVENFVQNINIGEAKIDLPSILYNNENYVKLRDFAALLKNINKDFKIIYNNKEKQISCITAYPYEPIGTELKPLESLNSAKKSTAKLDIDNNQKDLNAIIIKGHNYFRLRDLSEAFKIKVDYNILERIVYMSPLNENIEEVEAGSSLEYKNIETVNQLREEGYISNIKDNKLILTFCKKFNTGGYQLRCERVIYDGENIIVRPLIISPPLHAMVTQAITYPNCTIEINIEGVKPGFNIKVEGIEQSMMKE